MEEFDKHYVWGYVLGGSMLALGLFVFVPGMMPGNQPHRVGMLIFGAWYAVAGFGLLRKMFYGILLFYAAVLHTAWTLLQAHTWAEGPGRHILLLVWLALPAILYYRRFEQLAGVSLLKWKRREKERSTVVPEMPTRSLSSEEVEQVFEHMRERRKTKQQEPM
jgi:hypothetical protein